MIVIEKIHAREYHRNGISGDPFRAVEFEFRDTEEDGRAVHRAIATLPLEPSDGESDCRVLAVDVGFLPDITVCYRGDRFEGPLRAAMAEADRRLPVWSWRTDAASGTYEAADVADVVTWLIHEDEWSPLGSKIEQRDIARGAWLLIADEDGVPFFTRGRMPR